MKILTSDKQIELLIQGALLVSPSRIKKFENDEEVEIIVGSRELVRVAENINFPNLRFIQLLSAGYEGINLEKYRSCGVLISNAADVYGVGMAEYIIYAMLMSAKRYNRGIRNNSIRYQRGYNWITELAGKTVGILGCGAIGSQVAKRLSGFEMLILGYDPFRETCEWVNKVYKNIAEVLPLCDYIVVAVPFSETTKGMVNIDFLALCKKTVTIVNVGRRGLINDFEFLSALKSNKEMTAVLDMFELFPNSISNPYRRLSNVKVLPGVTAISREITVRRNQLVKMNIDRVINNIDPLFQL